MNSISDYEYDVFISYRRQTPVETWVEKYLYPEILKWLPDELPPHRPPVLFIDKNIRAGSRWPAQIQRAIRASRLLVPVLNSPFFASKWCLAELDTMLEREKLLGLSCEEQTEGLVYPIVFGDGRFFRDDIKRIQYRDMKKWASTADAFKSSKEFLQFESEVKHIAKDIAEMIENCPKFDPTWPAVTAPSRQPTHPAQNMSPPRFGAG